GNCIMLRKKRPSVRCSGNPRLLIVCQNGVRYFNTGGIHSDATTVVGTILKYRTIVDYDLRVAGMNRIHAAAIYGMAFLPVVPYGIGAIGVATPYRKTVKQYGISGGAGDY